MMIMNYRRSLEIVRIRNNPIISGLKVWSLCDFGYTLFEFPHSNRQPWRECAAYKNVLSHCSAAVERLSEEIPRRLHGRNDKAMYTIFMYNLFSSIKLFSLLRYRHIATVGTVRSNLAGFQRELALRGNKDVKFN